MLESLGISRTIGRKGEREREGTRVGRKFLFDRVSRGSLMGEKIKSVYGRNFKGKFLIRLSLEERERRVGGRGRRI